jgi:thiamine-monophosphate kinase
MLTERECIAAIVAAVAKYPAIAGSGLEASVGLQSLDDCAVIPIGDTCDLVIGSDFVRGEDFYMFRLGLMNWEHAGYYLVAANLSDLAAMGARPIGMTTAIRYARDMPKSSYEAVMEGIGSACRDFNSPLLGGDTGGYTTSVLSGTAIGVCQPGKAMLRKHGQPGDDVYVSGQVGRAGAALAYFLRGRPSGRLLPVETEDRLASAWRKPVPALALGAMLSENGLSRCAIDTSDGFKAACRQLAEASACEMILEEKSIPLDPLAVQVADLLEVDRLALAVSDSVDFRIVFTASEQLRSSLEAACKQAGLSVFRVGSLRRAGAAPGVYLLSNGERLALPGVEWAQSEIPSIDQLNDPAK